MPTRREFIQTSVGAAGLLLNAAEPRPKRIAIIATVYKYLSHAQHIGDRFLVGYPYAGAWHKPDMKVVSLYVDQKPEGDLSAARATEFGFQMYPTIAETLCCGGKELAVDAVMIVAEHGDYPRNEKGQILYPRYEFFQECVQVFRRSGRSVPVYNDKHLSYSFTKAQSMVETAHNLRFPMLGGSPVPVTFRLPELELPLGCEIDEAMVIGTGGPDALDFHALEGLQCMVERRRGGETGVKSVQLIEGDAVWQAGADGRYSHDLLVSAFSRSDTPLGLDAVEGRPEDLVSSGLLPKLVPNPAAYFVEYRDGLRATLLMLDGALKDYNFAARLKGTPEIQSTQFLLTPLPNVTHSACLVHEIEQMFETRIAPYPIERTLLVSGVLESCLTSKLQNHQRLETPHLSVSYRPSPRSTFCRS
jgi:hypothetical protein